MEIMGRGPGLGFSRIDSESLDREFSTTGKAVSAMTLAKRQLPASRPFLDWGAARTLFDPPRRTAHGADSPEISTPEFFNALETLAPHIFVLSMASPDLLVCQAAGRTAQAFLGSDAKGKKFYDLWTEASQKKLRRYFAVSARTHRAFRALSASRPTAIKPDRCTLFIPTIGADGAANRFIAITLRTGMHAPAMQPREIAHLHHIDFLQTQIPGEEKTSQSSV